MRGWAASVLMVVSFGACASQSSQVTYPAARAQASTELAAVVSASGMESGATPSGSGEGRCDPPEAKLVSFEVGSRIAIDPGDVDRVAGAMWISLKAHGYRSNTGRELTSGSAIQPPAPSQSVQAAHDGYRAEVTANYAGKFVEVDIVTPCLSSS